jgi:pimeloyl-ACP methyl ester carboxylesterase
MAQLNTYFSINKHKFLLNYERKHNYGLEKKVLDLNDVYLSYFDNTVSSNIILIFVHGWMDSKLFYLKLAKYLNDHVRIIIPDLRGHGESINKEDINNLEFTPDAFASDIELLIRQEVTSEKVVLVGHSMGGIICSILSRKIATVYGLVILNSTTNLSENWLSRVFFKGFPKLLKFNKSALAALGCLSFSFKANIDDVRLEYYSTKSFNPIIAISTFKNTVYQTNLEKIIQAIKFPILVISGEHDYGVPVNHSRKFLIHPRSKFFILPLTGHFTILENPKIVSHLILKYLTTILPKKYCQKLEIEL